MDAISQAACDTATLIRSTVPDHMRSDATRAAHLFNLCRITAYRSPIGKDRNALREPPKNDAGDIQTIESAIAYARSKGAE